MKECVNFICPECGSERLVQVLHNCEAEYEISNITPDGKADMDLPIVGGENNLTDRFRCRSCAFVVPNAKSLKEVYNWITNQEENPEDFVNFICPECKSTKLIQVQRSCEIKTGISNITPEGAADAQAPVIDNTHGFIDRYECENCQFAIPCATNLKQVYDWITNSEKGIFK